MRRRLLRVLAVGLVGPALAGCWAMPGQNAERTGSNPFEQAFSPANVDGLTEQWSVFAGRFDPTYGPRPVTHPVATQDGVHVASSCEVGAYDPATGTVRWRALLIREDLCAVANSIPASKANPPYVTPSRQVVAGMTTIPGLGYPPVTQAFDARTGAVVGAELPELVVAMRGDALATSSDFQALRVILRWPDGTVGDPIVVDVLGASAVTWGENYLYQAGNAGSMTTDPTTPNSRGTAVRAYQTAFGGQCGPLPHSDGTPVPVTCPRWVTPVDGQVVTAPVIGERSNYVYVGTDAGTVYRLDGHGGSPWWSTPVGAPVTVIPSLDRGTLFVPTADNRLVALAEGDGTELWTATLGSTITTQPAIAGGVVFVGTADGSVLAFDGAGCGAPSCPPLWSASAGSAVTGGPIVQGGQVYVGTRGGELIAYGFDD